ncbi:cupin domain-containing protein [Candidatus Daviesbacteria bacterium]|nr:cupin domain-containing protein [Candidatus Daviesbacteria bacterium]
MKLISLKNLPNEPVSHNPQILKKVILKKGLIPKLTNFSQATFKPGQIAPSHAHLDMYEVFFVTVGSGIIKINQKEYKLKKGVCVLVDPDETHEIVNSGLKDLVLTYFGIEK